MDFGRRHGDPLVLQIKMEIAATDYAWAAGVLDGEGYLGLHLSEGVLRALVRVNMCDEPTIARLHDMFPGSLKYGPVEAPSHKKAGKRPQFIFTLARRSAMKNALELLRPYVTTKKTQVEGLLRWLERPQRDISTAEREELVNMVNGANYGKSKWK